MPNHVFAETDHNSMLTSPPTRRISKTICHPERYEPHPQRHGRQKPHPERYGAPKTASTALRSQFSRMYRKVERYETASRALRTASAALRTASAALRTASASLHSASGASPQTREPLIARAVQSRAISDSSCGPSLPRQSCIPGSPCVLCDCLPPGQ